MAVRMQLIAPTPPGEGAVMWCASAFEAAPINSARMVAPRALADSISSSTRTPEPSASTKPLRSRSKGRDMLSDDIAVMLVKPAMQVGVMTASEEPVTMASHRPDTMSRYALPTDCVPAAQAVQVFSHGPCHPYFMEIAAEAALAMSIGTINGLTRRAPLCSLTSTCSSRVVSPPMPVPIQTPLRVGSPPTSPDIFSASSAAANAN
ncbi:unannotated protein [freshwater metagenome]|uniref:Unannotated protein n=1 Tax=freshwater metagenome TaxID=449393 RepID=A0A6J6L7K0_9ZZZZ